MNVPPETQDASPRISQDINRIDLSFRSFGKVVETAPEEEPLVMKPPSSPPETKMEPTVEPPSLMTKTAPDPPKSTAVEVDFYHNPTVLSRLVLNQKYTSAIRRLHQHPNEAAVWVCAKRGGRTSPGRKRRSNEMKATWSIRQLPLHTACSNLRRTHDPKVRDHLNQLISNLIVAYPAGAAMADHKGNVPLFEAVRHGASPETISMFLMAHPTSINDKDRSGRTLTELNQYRTSEEKHAVQEILDLGEEFWRAAQKEAAIKLKKKDGSESTESSVEEHEQQPEREEPHVISSDHPLQEPIEQTIESEDISSIAWDQLEERALALEQIVTEMNEMNFDLNKRLEDLLKEKKELLKKLDQAKGTNLTEEVAALQRENLMLNQQLFTIEMAYRQSVIQQGSQGTPQQPTPAGGSPPYVPLSFYSTLGPEEEGVERRSLLLENQELRKKYEELNKSYKEQRNRIVRLEQAVQRLTDEGHYAISSLSGGSAGDASSCSAMSPITWSEKSICSESSPERVVRRKTEDVKLHLEWNPYISGAMEMIDDMSVILHLAAEKEASVGELPPKVEKTKLKLHKKYKQPASRQSGSKQNESKKSLSKTSGSNVQDPPKKKTFVPPPPQENEQVSQDPNQELEIPALFTAEAYEPVERVGMDRIGLFMESDTLSI